MYVRSIGIVGCGAIGQALLKAADADDYGPLFAFVRSA